MSLKFNCDNCGRDMVVKYLNKGEKAKCKSCGAEMIVPMDAIEIDEKLLYDTTEKYVRSKYGIEVSVGDKMNPEIEKPRISKLALISFILGLLCLLAVIFPIATLAEIIPSMTIFSLSLGALLFLGPLTFILGMISRAIIRRKDKKIRGLKLANFSVHVAVLSGVLFLLIAIITPSNSFIYHLNLEPRCEAEIGKIACALESYIHVKKRYPENLDDLVKIGHLREVPKFRGEEYIYKVEKDNTGEYFVIECPRPEVLFKERGFLSPKRCLEIKYIQGKGLIVKTE